MSTLQHFVTLNYDNITRLEGNPLQVISTTIYLLCTLILSYYNIQKYFFKVTKYNMQSLLSESDVTLIQD